MSVWGLQICLILIGIALGGQYDYDGGYPLRYPSTACPSGLVTGGGTFEQNCCAAGQSYVKSGNYSVCCPDENDCLAEVEAGPKCADSSWQLCGGTNPGFCCEENWICFTQEPTPGNGGGVGCSTVGATLNSVQSEVITIYPANAGPGVTSSTSPSAGGSYATTGPGSAVNTGASITPYSTSSPTSATNLSSSNSPNSSKNSSVLSGGAIAGIAIGGLAFIVAVLALFLWARKRHPAQQTGGTEGSSWAKAELDNTAVAPLEMDSKTVTRSELPAGDGLGNSYVQERSPIELPSHS